VAGEGGAEGALAGERGQGALGRVGERRAGVHLGWDGKKDTVFCLDAVTGKEVWKQSYDSATILQWPGPRSTPAVSGGRVFTLGQHGQLNCYDAKTGKPVWNTTLKASYNPDVDYGFAWSPLVEGDHLIFPAGKGGLALKAADGTAAWGDDGAAGTCTSAVRFRRGKETGVALVLNNARESVSVVGVEPKTGKELWRSEPWAEKWGAACVDPLVVGESVFLTTAEQLRQSARFSVKDGKLTQDWVTKKFACYTGSAVHLDGFVYAVSKDGLLTCLDWKTGKEKWAERGFDPHGALTAADGHLFVQASHSGRLIVVKADPAGCDEVRRVQVFAETDAVSFTAPVLANGRLYCRSYAGEVVCLAVGTPSKE
jgi:outer membrane protein assembly factor BamB